MGAKLTAFENRAKVDMEIRVFVPPDRPDRYRMIIRVKPGEVKKVLTKRLFNWEYWDEYFSCEPDNHVFFMVFMDGVYSGVTLLPSEVKKYAKIIGYVDDLGVIMKGVRFTLTSFFRLK